MGYVLHWSNTIREIFKESREPFYNEHGFNRRIVSINPFLNLQADVLYPNAISSVIQSNSEEVDNRQQPSTTAGCIGSGLDNPFPFSLRSPVALPFLIYPGDSNESYPNSDVDIAALPILSWEAWVKKINLRKGTIKLLMNSYKGVLPYERIEEKSLRKIIGSIGIGNEEDPLSLKRKLTVQYTKKILTGVSGDIEASEQDPTNLKKGRGAPSSSLRYPKSKIHPPTPQDLKIKVNDEEQPTKPQHAWRLIKNSKHTFNNKPSPCLQSTYNYLYSGSGASSFHSNSLFVGNGSKLRMVTLKKNKRNKNSTLVSYSIEGIWEETKVPSNVNALSTSENENDLTLSLNDVIYEIKSQRQEVFVRRGKSLEIYRLENGLPGLIESIPNVGYGDFKYPLAPKKFTSSSPLLTSFDVNPNTPAKIIAADADGLISFFDIIHKKIVSHYKTYKQADEGSTLDQGCYLFYAGKHPDVVIYSTNSVISLLDLRSDNPKANQLFSFNDSEFLWDQECFLHKSSKYFSERIGTIAPSHNPIHYYANTTQNVLLFDIRVPNNPILRISHGFMSMPTFIQTVHEDDFEVVICGTGRNSEIFSFVTDAAHSACPLDLGCKKRNPILHSFPRNLSSQNQFFKYGMAKGFLPKWPRNFQRIKNHMLAWTSGMSSIPGLIKDARFPPSFALFTNNSFGDIYIQEWDHSLSNYSDSDYQPFLEKWKNSMDATVPSLAVKRGEGTDLTDMHMLFNDTQHEYLLRQIPFDPFKPHDLIHHRVKAGLLPVKEQMEILRKEIKSKRASEFIKVWDKDKETTDVVVELETDSPPLIVKEEPTDEYY